MAQRKAETEQPPLAEPPTPSRSPRALNECPHCDCTFVQPVSWKERSPERIVLELRCPDCCAWMVGCFGIDRVRELDRALQRGRRELREAYEQAARTNMRDMVDAFAFALHRDLIGPEDFV